jgi:hypothetical protein
MMLFAGSARAADDVIAFSTTETTTRLVYGNPGILPCTPQEGYELMSPGGDCWYEETREERLPYVLIDASEGKTMFPLEESPRAFADEKEFVEFVAQSLNGRPVYDEYGEIVGVEGESIEIGRPATADGFTQQVELIADPVAAFLGGKSNTFVIGRELYTLPSQREIESMAAISAAAGSLPSSGEKCNNARTDCIRGESFITHAVAYHSAGATTKQTLGGYREWSYFCWKGPIPWSCTGRSGSNRLLASSAVFYPAYNGEPALLMTFQENRANVTEVTAKAWQVGLKGQVANVSGACGLHSSEGSGGSFATGSGRYDGNRCGH